MPTWLVILITAIVTALATLAVDFIVRQFTKRDERVERKIEHLYSVSSDQFSRTMANLLTASFL
jgi:hypothetical protein